MKGKLCFGVLLALATTFGAFFVGSSDVNAYQYQLDYIPFAVPQTANNNGISLYDPFRVEGYDGPNKTQSRPLKEVGFYFNLDRSSPNDRCHFTNYYNIRSGGDVFRYSIPYYLQPGDFGGSASVEDTLPWISCQTNNPLPESLFSLNDWPVQQVESEMKDYLPYRFNLDGAFIRSNVSSEGLNRETKFGLNDVYDDWNDLPDYIYQMRIPLSISKIHFSAGDTLSFRGRFYIDSDDPVNSIPTFGSTAVAKLKTIGYSDYSDYVTYGSNTSVYTTTTCETLNLTKNNAENEAPYWIQYRCDVTIPNDTNIAGFTLDFTSTDSNIPFLSYPGFRFMSWDISFVITNNSWNPDPSGQPFQYSTVHSNNMNDVPGFAGDPTIDVSTDGFNWSESFKKLFNFSFTNPFQSLFALFASDSCVQIPTLASMLHSEETTVCPWFPSGVRAIVTPVLGVSSMMIIFGFAVRWLGARSGNFVEDSGGVDSGSYHFQNKFRRKNK